MNKTRLEAFSDAVLAIIITIMVLELKVPHGSTLSALEPLVPVILSYIMSFVFLAIYWNNHHHLLHTIKKVNGRILWANFHLLFWLSLVPFVTGWMGENHFAPATMALYGFILLMSALGYYILVLTILKSHGKDSLLARAIGKDLKGKISVVLYILGIAGTLINSWIAAAFYVAVAIIWLVPDKRIEQAIYSEENK